MPRTASFVTSVRTLNPEVLGEWCANMGCSDNSRSRYCLYPSFRFHSASSGFFCDDGPAHFAW